MVDVADMVRLAMHNRRHPRSRMRTRSRRWEAKLVESKCSLAISTKDAPLCHFASLIVWLDVFESSFDVKPLDRCAPSCFTLYFVDNFVVHY